MIKCKECGKEYERNSDLTRHVNSKHNGLKEYYNKYLIKYNEGYCEICGNETEFIRFDRGYRKYCSEKCRKKGRVENIESTTFEKYGVKNVNQLREIRKNIEKTNLEKYGNKCPMQDEIRQKKIKDKNLKNLGVELPFQSKEIQDKSSLIREMKYGAKYTYQSPILQQKIKKTNLEKYGFIYPLQNQEIFNKQQKNSLRRKFYKNTNLHFQGNYEYDFLEKYLDKFPDIENGKTIRYFYNKKWRTFYPDFYIPSLNLIIEIKGSYFLKENLKYKKKACKKAGFNWIMIINKDYAEFDEFLFCKFIV